MEDVDLDVDCCPVDESDKHRLGSLRLDSGYKSGLDRIQSFNLKSDVAEGRFATDEDRLIPLSTERGSAALEHGVKNLTLHAIEEGKLDSVDDGYHSKSVDLESLKKENICPESEQDSNELAELAHKQAVADRVFTVDDEGDTQLHSSIIHLLEPMSLFFISLVPDCSFLNIPNNYLQTPLHLTVITKQHLLTRTLMTSGAKVDVKDHKGNTPLHIAAKEGDALSAEILLRPVQYEEIKDLTYPISYQQIPQNLESRNYDGQVCIHLAAEGCHIDALSVLLSKGANINARDGKSGRTILHYAAESGNLTLLEFLLGQDNLDVDALTYSGLTPAMLAYGRNNTEVVQRLKAKGACFDSDESGEEEMDDEGYNDIKINGILVSKT